MKDVTSSDTNRNCRFRARERDRVWKTLRDANTEAVRQIVRRERSKPKPVERSMNQRSHP